jgi:hypothetical protein
MVSQLAISGIGSVNLSIPGAEIEETAETREPPLLLEEILCILEVSRMA